MFVFILEYGTSNYVFLNRNIYVSFPLLIKFRTPAVQIANMPSLSSYAFSNDPLANPRNFHLVQSACYNFDSATCCSSLSNHFCHWGTPMWIAGLVLFLFVHSSDNVKKEWKLKILPVSIIICFLQYQFHIGAFI